MKPFVIKGDKRGVRLSIPQKIWAMGGAEFFARTAVGNIEGNKEFAIKQLKKMAEKHGTFVIINRKTL